MEEEHRRRVWELYGWFSGLMCVGSVLGAVTWGAWMMVIVSISSYAAVSAANNVEVQSLLAQYAYWYAVFSITYAIAFLCLSVAKLLVLHRMADFGVPEDDGLSRRLAVGGRFVIGAAVAGNAVPPWVCAPTLQLQYISKIRAT